MTIFYSLPWTIKVFRKHCSRCTTFDKRKSGQVLILILTFLAYGSYHMSRRPLSIVKSVLYHDPTVTDSNDKYPYSQWYPFTSNSVLGYMDSCFLFSYAFFMFFSGYIAERCHIRYFLAFGMVGSGIFTYMFGLAYYYDIHNIYFFAIIQILSGAFQTTGWPAVVAAVAHWFGSHSSRGLIFGIWNSHTSFGNMAGAAISGAFVSYNWGLSFIVPGAIIAGIGFILFLFLIPYPEEIGLVSLDDSEEVEINEENVESPVSRASGEFIPQQVTSINNDTSTSEVAPLIDNQNDKLTPVHVHHSAISFSKALWIPGVIEFSLSLFFAKLVAYTFLYWLPKFIKDSTSLSTSASAYLSTPFDIGGIIGAVAAGVIADRSGCAGLTCIAMLFFTVPVLLLYLWYGTISTLSNIGLQSVLGFLVNGPYSLITTAVSANLGAKVTDSKALATVAAIIDGTGSIGAAVGPLLAGVISNNQHWNNVFYMVIISDILALLFLLRIAKQEVNMIWSQMR